ncbi:MAG: hypothetical protein IAE79_23765 [Anaerolinea sp.]|nr:hypothetical protein [Anaerolinea sp.]
MGGTLDALYPHLETIWLGVVEVAIRYAQSEQVDFGFAHNAPMNKRKFKLALNATADGNIS